MGMVPRLQQILSHQPLPVPKTPFTLSFPSVEISSQSDCSDWLQLHVAVNGLLTGRTSGALWPIESRLTGLNPFMSLPPVHWEPVSGLVHSMASQHFRLLKLKCWEKSLWGVNTPACVCVCVLGFVAWPFCLTLSGRAFVCGAVSPKQPRISGRLNQVSSASLTRSDRPFIGCSPLLHCGREASCSNLWFFNSLLKRCKSSPTPPTVQTSRQQLHRQCHW